MKVLLINPPRQHEIIGNNPSIIEDERGFNPPLGLLYVAGHLEAQRRHDVSVLDAQVERLSYDDMRRYIKNYAPDLVGITTMTMTLIDVMATVNMVKELLPATGIVIGGPHAYLYPEEMVALPGVDALVLGEGEIPFAELVDVWRDSTRLQQIKGIVFKNGDDIINTGFPSIVEDLDSLHFPARHLTPIEKYNSLLSAGDIVTTLFTSRGCPFGCRFCDRPHLGKHFRARSAENVLVEIEQCLEMGIREILIYDDTFTVDIKRAKRICDLIVERKLNLAFDIRTRVDTIDEELLRKLKAAGCQGIHYGVEAGTERILRVLNKGITLAQVARAFEMTKRIGIPILAYFMIGNPGETMKDIHSTFQFIRQLNPDYLHMTILTPFPGTDVYSELLEKGLLVTDEWQEFAKSPDPEFTPPHWSENFSRQELNKLLVEGYRGFYLRPSYIFKRIIDMRSFGELMRKIHAGFSVLRMKADS